ncbi:LysR family transcriptional regulator [Agarivorans sp. QJM3NY_29]|uniref:LysR family transcriptional regulator n=1 Tax=unclassified Agarivorans TaxID=2636026 RepID=UPI003D7D317E
MKYLDKTSNQSSKIEKSIVTQLVWDDARCFLALARNGTLTASAQTMGIGIATLSRRIERLEKALGLPLFIRQQTGYLLSEEGKALLNKAEQMEAASQAFISDAECNQSLSGKIRLATAENLASHLILPALPAFYQQYPQLKLEILTGIHTSNLHRNDADLALRMVRPSSGHVSFKRIGQLGYGLYASLGFLEQQQLTPSHSVNENDAFISWNDSQSHLPAAQWVQQILKGCEPILTTSSVASQLSACCSGLGFAVLPNLLAVKQGLVRIDTDVAIDQAIYLVIQADLCHSPRIRAMADFLSDLVKSNQHQLE